MIRVTTTDREEAAAFPRMRGGDPGGGCGLGGGLPFPRMRGGDSSAHMGQAL